MAPSLLHDFLYAVMPSEHKTDSAFAVPKNVIPPPVDHAIRINSFCILLVGRLSSARHAPAETGGAMDEKIVLDESFS